MGLGQRGRALGEPLAGAEPSGQRLDEIGQRILMLAHQGEDLSRRQSVRGRVMRHGPGSAHRIRRAGMRLDAEPTSPLELAVQGEPRARRIALFEPWLIEEGRLHHAGFVGHGGLDQRSHAAPPDRARGDAPHLHDDGGAVAGNELGHRSGLPLVPR